MQRYKKFILEHWFAIAICVILCLAIFLRFYNYHNRWGLAYDQARDVIVAREALRIGKIPLIGPFASAGQFVYGPQWFWILMGMVLVYPPLVIVPWVIQTLLYVLIVLIMIEIGREIDSKLMALILGFVTAISSEQISQSTNLTSPSMVGIFAVLALYFFIKYLKYKKNSQAFWMAFIIAISINIHFQAIGLLCLIPIAFIFDSNKNLKKAFVLLIGTLIPFIPLIIFDISNNFFESRNWIDYFINGQYRVYVPNRWLTYLGIYLPTSWAKILGGEKLFGYLFMFFLPILFSFSFLRRKLNKTLLAVLISFLAIIIMLRYYRGERIDSNLIFIQPFILVLSVWIISQFYRLNRILGIGLLVVISFFTLRFDLLQIKNSENFTAVEVNVWKESLLKKLPNNKFAFYDLEYAHGNKVLPLVLSLESINKIDDKGIKLGFFIATSKTDFKYPSVVGNRGGYQVLNINNATNKRLENEKWAFVNPSQIYKSTVEWYKK